MDNNQTYNYNPYAQNVAILKSYFKRPAVLIVGIIFLISLALSIASIFAMPTDYIGNTYAQLYNDMGLYEEAKMFQDFYSSPISGLSSIISALPSLALSALMGIAYIIIYKKSKDDNINSSPKAGFVILFIISIVQLVMAIGVTALFFGVFAIMWIALYAIISTDYKFPTNPQDELIVGVTFGVCALILALMFTLVLVYSISRMKYTKSLKDSVSSVQLSFKGAKAYGVSSIIFAVMELLFLFPTLIIVLLSYYIADISPVGLPIPLFSISLASVVLSGVLYIIDGIVALGYRKHIRNLTNNYAEGPYNYGVPATYPQDMYQTQENEFPQPQTEQSTFDAQPPQSIDTPQFNDMPVYTPPQEQKTEALYCCPQCGSAYSEKDVFCNICGTKLK